MVQVKKASLIHPVRGRASRVQSRIALDPTQEPIPFVLPRQPDSEVKRFALGNRRNVVVAWFRGKLWVHIREYSWEDRPTEKGICLTPSRWATLASRTEALEEDFLKSWEDDRGMDIQDEGQHLGGNVYAKASYEYKTVDIRKYFVPEGIIRMMPTRKGIRLRNFEWRSLVRQIPEITGCCPELREAIPCNQTHVEMPGFLACSECNPQAEKM